MTDDPDADGVTEIGCGPIASAAHDPGLSVLADAAAALLRMPMAWIVLAGIDRRHLLVATGPVPEPGSVGHADPFCVHAANRGGEALVIEDTHRDPRFRDSALVRGPLAVRCYAGMPLRGREGTVIGTICVLGRAPRRFDRRDRARLAHLAQLVSGVQAAQGGGGGQTVRTADAPGGMGPGASLAWCCDADGVVRERPRAVRGVPDLGLAPGSEWVMLADPRQRDTLRASWRKAAEQSVPFEQVFRAHDGRRGLLWLGARLSPPTDPAADPRWCGSIGVVDEVPFGRGRVADPRTHDPLTGLVNRQRFQTLLEHAVLDSRLGLSFAVLYLDLDDFKLVNDTFGHDVGDRVLREIGVRLAGCVRRTDVAGRLGGDEFLAIQTGAVRAADAAAFAQRIIDALSRPIPYDGQSIEVSVSVGIALAPRDGSTGAMLMRHADLAQYRAKHDGKGTARFFDPTMDAAASRRLGVKRDLRHALDRGELFLDYQPILSLHRRRVSGLEALLRWRHPVRGIVSPAEFVPIAEATGAIVPIGAWVLREACRTAAGWPADVRIAVNMSPLQFAFGDVEATVSRVLAETGIAPGRLEIEITETLPLLDNDRNLRLLRRLRALGVRAVLDDFGTAYSSLAYLGSFRFDKIKLDRSFVAAMTRREGLSIARAIIALANDLSIAVTAEGVESTRQMEQVAREGCSEAQGFRIARPMPPGCVPAALSRIDARFGGAATPTPDG